MNLFGFGTSKPKRICVVGAGCYLGYKIAEGLRNLQFEVVGFDEHAPKSEWKTATDAQKISESNFEVPDLSNLTFIQGDVTNCDHLEVALENVDLVIHCGACSLDEHGPDAFDDGIIPKDVTEKVIVYGTKNIIDLCIKKNISSLVFTSSERVVFSGQKIINGDESLPYRPFNDMSHFSMCECIAEQLILTANSKQLADGRLLSTCALRLPYMMKVGQDFKISQFEYADTEGCIGVTGNGYFDRVSIHNAVHAHIRAAQKLLDDNQYITVMGQVYFITDGKPINSRKFLKNEVDAHCDNTNCTAPWFCLVALWHFIIGYLETLSPDEAFSDFKVSHYYSIKKARLELDYNPTSLTPMGRKSMNDDAMEDVQDPEARKFGEEYDPAKTDSDDSYWNWKRVIVDIWLAGLFTVLILSFLPLVM